MELLCYTYEGWEPRIRPASPRRDWMEDTPERFAYRCLPLALANAHGWEMLSPCGFEARWSGGSGTEAVEIRTDPGTEPRRAPVSLFGQGTLTFHIEGLFRTSEGWNLWVGGPPNFAKDAIAPLGGVIETDWSPYSFTMNWRFTRPGQWVRFEENEPFCFFFPVQRGVVAGTVPQLRPIEEAPDLKAGFDSWSRSRDAFHKWVAETQPAAPSDKWQKLYFRGIAPDGAPGAPDHEFKLRAAPFRQADGTALAPAECPMRSKLEVSAAPAADPSPAEETALRRREWLLDVQERQRALSPRTGGVPRVHAPSSDAFLDAFYAAGRPVVITGAMDGWPALTKWTPDHLRAAIGDAPVEFQGARTGNPDFELYKDGHKRTLPFGRYMDLIELDGPGNDAYITAYNSAANAAALAPLERDMGYLDRYLTPAHGMMWIGPAGTFTPLHFDLTNNLLAQVCGRKRVILVPPSETRLLHNRRHVFSDVHDITDEAHLARFPSARTARRMEVDLAPGDLLFIPFGWWHQVTSRAFSVMLTYTNFLWPNDAYESFPADRP